ncbi:hypothetical protein SLA2020_230940 [Shorea laevis]
MVISTSCCLNVSPPTLPSSSTSKPTQQVSWSRNNEKWRRQCLVGMAAACVVIGLQLGNNSEDISTTAVAQEMQGVELESKKKAITRWSDKRMCPPWRFNSLETIVPENLPRPSARRRWEAVRNSDNIPPAAKVVIKIRNRPNCFSM